MRCWKAPTGQEVTLLVADNPEGDNFREIKLVPEAAQQKQQREYYQQWVTKCRTATTKGSSNQVAYLPSPE